MEMILHLCKDDKTDMNKYNATRNKYKGSGAGESEKERL